MLSKDEVMKAVNKKRTEKIIPIEPVQTPNGSGGFKNAWTPRVASMAKFRKITTKNDIINGAVVSVLYKELEVMYRTDIKNGWRVKHGTKTYSVEDTYSYDTKTTILVCKEVSR